MAYPTILDVQLLYNTIMLTSDFRHTTYYCADDCRYTIGCTHFFISKYASDAYAVMNAFGIETAFMTRRLMQKIITLIALRNGH
jgi:hypothetical protein